VVISTGLVVTFARVGYIAVATGLCLCLLYNRRFGALAGLLIGLPIVALGLFALGDALPMVAAALGTGTDTAGSIDYRSMLIDAGLELVRQHPLAGLSMPDILDKLEHLRQGEGIIDLVNEPLTIMMRAGIPAGLIYFLMTFRVLIELFINRRRLDAEGRACAAACFASIVALLVGLLTTSFGRNETSFIVLLAAGAGLMARAPTRGQKIATNAALLNSPTARPAIAVPSISSS
jgi:O-antigen ligase